MNNNLLKKKKSGEKIAILTAYDATFAQAVYDAGVDAILVGDSLGMVIQGKRFTQSVRLSDMVYHVQAVAAGAPNAHIIADMPFATFQASPIDAYKNAAKCIAAGASMVKMEGGMEILETITFLTQRSIPVCAHLGLRPQSVYHGTGYRVQGREEDSANQIIKEAQEAQEAGASCVLLELIPSSLAQKISESLIIPTIGIGSGCYCDGQVLVLQDMIGLTPQNKRFIRNFLTDNSSIQEAVTAYVKAVKSGEFPSAAHAF